MDGYGKIWKYFQREKGLRKVIEFISWSRIILQLTAWSFGYIRWIWYCSSVRCISSNNHSSYFGSCCGSNGKYSSSFHALFVDILRWKYILLGNFVSSKKWWYSRSSLHCNDSCKISSRNRNWLVNKTKKIYEFVHYCQI